MREIDRLRHDLVALSACQTGVPTGETNGSEVETFGGVTLLKGAGAVIATLWPVADASTAAFMQQFYTRLANGQTKGAALAETQRAFIRGEVKPDALDGALSTVAARGVARSATRGGASAPRGAVRAGRSEPRDWSHPYHWAPFTLMGDYR